MVNFFLNYRVKVLGGNNLMYQIFEYINNDDDFYKKLGSQAFKILLYIAANSDENGLSELTYNNLAKIFDMSIDDVEYNILILKSTVYKNIPVLSETNTGFILNLDKRKKVFNGEANL